MFPQLTLEGMNAVHDAPCFWCSWKSLRPSGGSMLGQAPRAPGRHNVLYRVIRDKGPALRPEALALVVISAHAVLSFISIMFNLLKCWD